MYQTDFKKRIVRFILPAILCTIPVLTVHGQGTARIVWQWQNDTLYVRSDIPDTKMSFDGSRGSSDLSRWISMEEYQRISEVMGAEHIVVEEGVKSIGKGGLAFFAAKTVTIPASVTEIGKDALFNCHRLQSIFIAQENAHYCSIGGVLYNKNATVLIVCPQDKEGSVKIPESVTAICDEAIYSCSSADFYVSWMNPPKVTDGTFGVSKMKSKCKIEKLHIPAGTKNSYKQAGWMGYFKKVVEDN